MVAGQEYLTTLQGNPSLSAAGQGIPMVFYGNPSLIEAGQEFSIPLQGKPSLTTAGQEFSNALPQTFNSLSATTQGVGQITNSIGICNVI